MYKCNQAVQVEKLELRLTEQSVIVVVLATRLANGNPKLVVHLAVNR